MRFLRNKGSGGKTQRKKKGAFGQLSRRELATDAYLLALEEARVEAALAQVRCKIMDRSIDSVDASPPPALHQKKKVVRACWLYVTHYRPK